MVDKRAIPFLVVLLASTVVQWAVILVLWALLPLNVARVTKPGWDITYITHSGIPLLACFGMVLLAALLGVFLRRRYRSVALGLWLSIVPGLLLGIVYMLQGEG